MNAGNIIATLKLKTDEFHRGLNTAKTELQKTSADFKKVGAGMVAIGGAMATGLGYAVKTTADFEQQMSKVKALSGATDSELNQLSDTAKMLGASTKYTATQAGQGMEYMAMAGWEVNDIISALPGVLNMASAGATDLGVASDIASNIMSGFNIEAEKSGEVADVLTKAFTSSNTNLEMLGLTMSYVAPSAKAVGWSLEEVASATGLLGDAGIQGSKAGTALRKAITSLSAPTKEGGTILDKYKISITNAKGQMRPLADILGQMKTKFADLTDTQKASRVEAIFGTEAMSAMLTLMEDPQAINDFTKELENSGGTAERIADEQMDNLTGSIELLKSAFDSVQLSIGEHFIAPLRAVAGWLQNLLVWFNGLPEGVQKFIAWTTAISTVLLLVGGAFLLFIGFLPALISGFQSFIKVIGVLKTGLIGLATNPIALVILAVMALIAIFVVLYKKNEAFRNKVIQIWNAIVAFMQPVISYLVNWVKTTWNGVVAWWNEIMPIFLQAVKNVWNGIWFVLEPIINAIVAIIKWAFPFVLAIIMLVWDNIKNIIEGTIGAIMNIIEIFSYLFTGQWGKLWESVKSLFFNVLKVLWNAFQLWGMGKMFKFLGGLLGRFLGTIGRFGGSIVRTIFNFLGRILSKFNIVGTVLKTGIRGVTGFIKSMFTSMVGAVIGSLTSLIGGIKSKVKRAKEWLGELNPFKRHSPSLVDNVLAGVKKIKDTYKSVGDMEVSAPKIGGLTPGRIDVEKVVGTGDGKGSETNYNAPLVNVDKMEVRNDSDIRDISSELYNLQRNSERSRGR